MVKRAVFLDRDGVINANIVRDGRPVAPTSLEQFRLLPGVEEAARRLNEAGYDIIVITNQPDVATGRTRRETVEAMHDVIRARMPVAEIKVCFHTDADNCSCRKPKPGMILESANERGIDLQRSWVIGDRWRDIEAGRIAGCLTVFVDYGYEQEGPNSPNVVVSSLAEAAQRILALDDARTEPITLSRRRDNAMNTPSVDSLRIKIFADGADLKSMKEASANPLVKGFTTNPTLMRQAGVTDYKAFAREVLAVIPDRPVSFEVFADDFATMEAQGKEIASWGDNVYVKIPVTNTKGEFAGPLLATLSRAGVKLNVTALMTLDQVRKVGAALAVETPAVVSVFAGRIADTGRDPVPLMRDCVAMLKNRPKAELLWASPRELLNIFQADEIGCHIITVTGDVIKKLALVGKDLDAYSRETVAMFHRDATSAGFDIPVTPKKAAS